MTNLDSIFKSRQYFANKGLSSQGCGFSCGHVWVWELDCEEGWVPNNWCFWTVVLEKTLESPLDCKEIQPVHSEGDQPWDLFGRNDAKAEAPVLWPPHAKSWLIGKDSDAGRDWGQEEKGTTEDEMAGWYHWLDGRQSEWTRGDGDGQGGLACCDSWGRKESDTTERLNWTELNWTERVEWWNNTTISVFLKKSSHGSGQWTERARPCLIKCNKNLIKASVNIQFISSHSFLPSF